tara:strand:+ start:149 stop:1084 length:936 start_codon:yes stop_codon:yes gene_type:complete
VRIDFANDGAVVPCDANEKDVARLASYRAVVYAQPQSLPFLGWSVAAPTKLEKAGKAKKEKNNDKEDKVHGGEGETGAMKEKAPKPPKEPKAPPKPKQLDDSLVPALIKHIHGKKDGIEKLVKEFLEAHMEQEALMSKSNVEKMIKLVAKNGKRVKEGNHGNARWVVAQEHIDKAGLTIGEAATAAPAEGEAAPAFDLAPVVFTPPRAPKRVRSVKATEDRGPAKSARLRGDHMTVVKGLGDDWWPSPPASPAKEGAAAVKEPVLPSNDDGEVDFMEVPAEEGEKPAESRQEEKQEEAKKEHAEMPVESTE